MLYRWGAKKHYLCKRRCRRVKGWGGNVILSASWQGLLLLLKQEVNSMVHISLIVGQAVHVQPPPQKKTYKSINFRQWTCAPYLTFLWQTKGILYLNLETAQKEGPPNGSLLLGEALRLASLCDEISRLIHSETKLIRICGLNLSVPGCANFLLEFLFNLIAQSLIKHYRNFDFDLCFLFYSIFNLSTAHINININIMIISICVCVHMSDPWS